MKKEAAHNPHMKRNLKNQKLKYKKKKKNFNLTAHYEPVVYIYTKMTSV